MLIVSEALVLDVKKLRVLRELHLRGTLAEVARALNYSPSAVSQQLAALETELGVELLRKQGRRVQLTPQAELLVEHTTAVLERLERAEVELQSSLGRPTGRVRIAAFQSAVLALLPGLMRALRDEHPGLRIEVVQHEPESSLYRTFAGDFDLVIAEQYPGHAAPHHEGLDRVRLTDDALRLAVPPDSRVRRLVDCRDDAWVMEPPGTASRHWAEQQCRLAGFEPDVRFETADLQAQARLIATGNASGFTNDLTWAYETPPVRLVDLPGSPRRETFTTARLGAAAGPEIRVVRETLDRVALTMRRRIADRRMMG